jgi:hypothetical protein
MTGCSHPSRADLAGVFPGPRTLGERHNAPGPSSYPFAREHGAETGLRKAGDACRRGIRTRGR